MLQRLALAGSHVVHATPAMPHDESEGGVHTPPAQQPPGHEVASHMQVPPRQRWPAAHGGPPPQRHSPSIEQVSTRTGSQAMHAAAPTPHADTERG